ncbi:hypothetical protein QO002_001360 [Pararhizobium capsulatum DSM 1112]|uniref:Cellulose biosynthesis protein BcsN n=1 Tax=Pararhizobium capsulatum DSM 1112 TaxID=1121113 RepID=A0ABU0BQR5_9HYPH|nr:cellulose biosynthesis protein BcsN [Pararhizobium capsulatum]MDQ0319222.1 hypothetical protein [Pararhizobium capsulatum DSM 1112]
MMKYLSFGLLALIVSGCTSVDDPFLNASAPKAGGPAISSSVSRDLALAVLPVAGGASSVRQTVLDSKAEQVIVYPNATTIPGENLLTVSAGASGKSSRAPSRAAVVAEMRRVLPGVRMAINPAIGENAYGVFGYATGALPGNGDGSCLYAWQVTPQQEKPSFSGHTRAAALRLRYCSTSASEEKIVGLMRGLRLRPIDTDTIDGLQMAAGTGAASDIEMFAAEIPASSRMARREVTSAVVVEEQQPGVAPEREARPIQTKVAAAEQPPEKPAAVINAVKVPMPGDAAALAETEEENNKQSVEAVESASQVPLPGKLLIANTK